MITHHTDSVYFLWLKRSIKFTEWQFGLFTMSAKTIHIQLYLCFKWISNKPEHFVWILLALWNLCSASVTQKFYKKLSIFVGTAACCLLLLLRSWAIYYMTWLDTLVSQNAKTTNKMRLRFIESVLQLTADRLWPCRCCVCTSASGFHIYFVYSFGYFFFQILLSLLWFLSSSRSCVSLLLSLVTTSFFRQYIRIQTH